MIAYVVHVKWFVDDTKYNKPIDDANCETTGDEAMQVR